MKANYLKKIEDELNKYNFNDLEKVDIIKDYNELYDDYVVEGLVEDEIVNKLGEPMDVISSLAVDLGKSRVKSKSEKHSHKTGKYIALTPFISTVIFLIIGFGYNIWHPTWMVFLLIPMTAILIGDIDRFSERIIAITPFISSIIYLYFGFIKGIWHPTWLIFLMIPMTAIIVSEYKTSLWNFLLALSPFLAIIFYVILGHFYGLWNVGWLVFLSILLFAHLSEKEKNPLLIIIVLLSSAIGYLYLIEFYGQYSLLVFIPYIIILYLFGYIRIEGIDKVGRNYVILIIALTITYLATCYFIPYLWGLLWLIYLLIPIYAICDNVKGSERFIALSVFVSFTIFYALGYVLGIWHLSWIALLIIPVSGIVFSD